MHRVTPATYDMSDVHGREAGLRAAERALRDGKLVAMPTETVYGLAADAGSDAAVAAIYRAKGRPGLNPLIAHIAAPEAAAALAIVPEAAARLAERYWPGPLTLVLRRRPGAPVSTLATAGLDTLALRVPAAPVAHDLLARFGRAVVAPSANLSGHVSTTAAAHVRNDLGASVAVILDDGPSTLGIESTVVGFTGERPTLLRPGAVAAGAIEDILGDRLAAPSSAEGPAVVAPGMLASHYAPRARVRLDVTHVRAGEALLTFGGIEVPGASEAAAVANLSERGDLDEAAANLFAALRRLDTAADTIAVTPIPDAGVGAALNDRLRRAAAPRGQALDSSVRTP